MQRRSFEALENGCLIVNVRPPGYGCEQDEIILTGQLAVTKVPESTVVKHGSQWEPPMMVCHLVSID